MESATRGRATVLALWAGAAQMGTAFVLAAERAAPAPYRKALGEPRPERTTITAASPG